jgi:hypothetical protein
MGNEVILHGFFVIIINESKADLRLKWKKWEMIVLCILIDTHRITYQEKPYRRNKKVLSTKIPIKRIESLIDIKK